MKPAAQSSGLVRMSPPIPSTAANPNPGGIVHRHHLRMLVGAKLGHQQRPQRVAHAVARMPEDRMLDADPAPPPPGPP
jgi:hypothetical protein